jgi:hypothetical protein
MEMVSKQGISEYKLSEKISFSFYLFIKIDLLVCLTVSRPILKFWLMIKFFPWTINFGISVESIAIGKKI